MFNEVPRQGRCGDCWAHVSALTVSQRRCINDIDPTDPGKNVTKESLSPRYLATCGMRELRADGCKGTNLNGIIVSIRNGVVTGSTDRSRKTGCQPYLLPSCMKGDDDHKGCKEAVKRKTTLHAGECEFEKCDSSTDTRLRAVGWDGKQWGGILAIQEELKRGGPMIAKIFANDKKELFKKYEKGILEVPPKLYEKSEPDHFIALLGFNTVRGTTPYWIAVNTWGERWGEGGFVRILLGNNTLHVEKNVCFLHAPGRNPVYGIQTHLHYRDAHNHPWICQSLRGGRVCKENLTILGYDMKLISFGCITHSHPEYHHYRHHQQDVFRGNFTHYLRKKVRVPVICH